MTRFAIFLIALLSSFNSSALTNSQELKGYSDVVRITFSNGWICSGAFINPITILAAAHCLDAKPSVTVSKITAETDVNVSVQSTFMAPEFSHQLWPASDIGIIKTSAYTNFSGAFKLSTRRAPNFGHAVLYGCGRVNPSVNKDFRKVAHRSYFRIGSILFFIGEPNIAAHDSGGIVIDDASKEIIAVMTTTTAKDSKPLLVLGTATSTASDANLSFLNTHL